LKVFADSKTFSSPPIGGNNAPDVLNITEEVEKLAMLLLLFTDVLLLLRIPLEYKLVLPRFVLDDCKL